MFHVIKKNKSYILILIISIIFCLDLFLRAGRPSTFDGPTHLTNIAQFSKALSSGDFPVRWMDRFANYGMPMPIIVQQTTAYLGAFFVLLFNNVVFAYNLVVFFGTLVSLLFLYKFLRLHFSEIASLFAVILFNFAPYRIINIYVRGALPEFFSHVFFPIIFLGLFHWIKKRQTVGLLCLLVGLVGILLTHPFTLVIGSFLFVPYGIWLLFEEKQNPVEMRFIVPVILVVATSLGLAGYYIIPLFSEIKYFYYGQGGDGLKPNQFLTVMNYVGDYWYYFTKNDIDVRGHIIHLGSLELFIVIAGLIISFIKVNKNRFIIWVYISFVTLVFFTSYYANPIYQTIKLLGGIQYNWRMFASIIFIPPIIGAFIYDSTKSKLFIWGVILLLIVIRTPQLYGKNYLVEPQSKYYWTLENMHGNVLNTVWTGKTEDYPVKKAKGGIISGQGEITNRIEQNSWRKYKVSAKTELRLVDNTFYFPGWKVYVDAKEVPIEFQDMNYRGVITYKIPQGDHSILVKFADTKIRMAANIISIISIGVVGILILLRKRLFYHPTK